MTYLWESAVWARHAQCPCLQGYPVTTCLLLNFRIPTAPVVGYLTASGMAYCLKIIMRHAMKFQSLTDHIPNSGLLRDNGTENLVQPGGIRATLA